MPASACCSAITSGVAIRSVDLHSNHAVLDEHREGVDGHVRRQVQGLSGPQVEARAVPRALDRAVVLVELAFDELAVVVRAAILDREDLATAVDHADLEILVLEEPLLPGGKLVERADVDQGTHHVIPIPEVGILSTGVVATVWRHGSATARGGDDFGGAAGGADPASSGGRAAAARDGAGNALRACAGARGCDSGRAAAAARRGGAGPAGAAVG